MLKRFLLVTLFVLAAFGSPAVPARADYTTTINPSTKWGVWEGWGCSLAWWANVFGSREDIADIVFTTKSTALNGEMLPGLGMTIARYNIGGCSIVPAYGSSIVFSPKIPDFKKIQGYWLDWRSADPASDSWNWFVDSNQRTMLWKARDRGATHLEMFSDTPMWWMCNNSNPSGANNGTNNNLQTWNTRQHAVYLATVAKYAADNWGVTFDSVEAFNEPIANWWVSIGTQEGCHFDTSMQATVAGALRTELDSRGLTTMKVAASDENTYDQATSTWNSFNAAAQSAVGRVDVHGYQYGDGRRDLLFRAVNGKNLWNTEYGEGDASGMSLASNLNLDLRWLHPTAWCYWQPLDSGGWGLIQSNPSDNWIGTANPKYFVLAQFSRHIRSGMTIIDGGESNTTAAYDAVAHKLVLVTTNYGTGQWVNYDLSRFGIVSGPITRWATDTGSTGDKYAVHNDTVLNGKKFRAYFSPHSVQTFEIQNTRL